jgi:hypothetical protein
MDKDEIALRKKIRNLLEVYELDDILAENDMEIEDALVVLVNQFGLVLPEHEPLDG